MQSSTDVTLDKLKSKDELQDYSTPDIHYDIDDSVSVTVETNKEINKEKITKEVNVNKEDEINKEVQLKRCKESGLSNVEKCKRQKYYQCNKKINRDSVPWPTIITVITGGVLIIYTAIAPNVNPNRRIFGVLLLLLWTILWGILLGVMWAKGNYIYPWWLMFIPIVLMLLFFLFVIVFNIGSY